MRRVLPLLVLLLAGCARSEDASITVDMNRIAPDIAPRNGAEEEITAGVWRESAQDNSPALEFADTAAQTLASLRCAEGGGLLLQRHGASQASGNPTISLSVGRERRELQASLAAPGLLRATLNAGDPLMTALASAATPIGVRAAGMAPLLLPPGPPVSAFVNRCAASGAPAPAASNSSAGNAIVANSSAPEGNSATTR